MSGCFLYSNLFVISYTVSGCFARHAGVPPLFIVKVHKNYSQVCFLKHWINFLLQEVVVVMEAVRGTPREVAARVGADSRWASRVGAAVLKVAATAQLTHGARNSHRVMDNNKATVVAAAAPCALPPTPAATGVLPTVRTRIPVWPCLTSKPCDGSGLNLSGSNSGFLQNQFFVLVTEYLTLKLHLFLF